MDFKKGLAFAKPFLFYLAFINHTNWLLRLMLTNDISSAAERPIVF